MPIRVVLVDNVGKLRAALPRLLEVRGDAEVAAEADDAASAIAAVRAHRPDIVVLNLGLFDLGGHAVLTALRDVSPEAMIVVYGGTHAPDRLAALATPDACIQEPRDDMGYLVGLLDDVGRRAHHTAMLHVGPDTDDVRRARHFAVDRCDLWNFGNAAGDVSLVVSELVANALVHGRSTCELTVGHGNGVVRVEVVDRGDGVPDLEAASAESEHGRGLMLVSMLCAAWGTEPRGGGKCVWAEMIVTQAAARGGSGASSVAVGTVARDDGLVQSPGAGFLLV